MIISCCLKTKEKSVIYSPIILALDKLTKVLKKGFNVQKDTEDTDFLDSLGICVACIPKPYYPILSMFLKSWQM